MPVVVIIVLVAPNIISRSHSLLNCEALPGSEVRSYMYFIAIKYKYAACVHVHKIMPNMLAIYSMLLHTYYAKIMLA